MEKENEILLNNAKLHQLCTIKLVHDLPCDWNVHVVVGGVKFFYQGGGDFTDGPHPLDLTCKQETYFRNNDPSKCVNQVQMFCTVVIPGNPGQHMGQAQTCPAGKCLVSGGFILRPKRIINESILHEQTPIHIELVNLE